MNTKLFSLAFLPLFLFSEKSLASVSCDAAKITEVVIYDTKVVVKQSGVYRGLGFTATAQNQDKKLSVVLAAKATGDLVKLVYPDGYNCNENNYGEDPEMVIVQ